MSAIYTRSAPKFLAFLIILVACGLTTSSALAGARVALVIGNASYQYFPKLFNPTNDAADVAAALRAQSFTVKFGKDLDLKGMKRLVDDFVESARGAEVLLFYYAGHGFQITDNNYLVPIDAMIRGAGDIDQQALDLKFVTRALEGVQSNHLVFLDACRNNPLHGAADNGDAANPGLRDGLAKVGDAADFLYAYATQPNNVARDGSGRNSPFAKAFLSHLATQGQDIGAMMISVRRDVVAATGGLQIPWENSSLRQQVYLAPGKSDGLSAETRLWQLAAASGDPVLLRIYLARHPTGTHVKDAEGLLDSGAVRPGADVVRSTPTAGSSEDRLWDFALRSRARALVEYYLDRHPGGQHASEAHDLLQHLPTVTGNDAKSDDAKFEEHCELATTHPRDATANNPGVALADLARNAKPAIEACRQARKARPDNPHYGALLGRALAADGQKQEAVALYREAAGKGDLRAQVSLGLMLETGDDVSKDPRAAIELYRSAADGGSSDGAINFAVALLEGKVTRRDPKRAVNLLRRAAENGSAIAYYNLGVLAQDGTIKEADEAFRYFVKATELGDPRGFVSAAILLDEGRSITKDPETAADFLLRGVAADSGEAREQIVHRSKSWSPGTMRAVQGQLKKAGFYEGPVDGRIGVAIPSALDQYRRFGMF